MDQRCESLSGEQSNPLRLALVGRGRTLARLARDVAAPRGWHFQVHLSPSHALDAIGSAPRLALPDLVLFALEPPHLPNTEWIRRLGLLLPGAAIIVVSDCRMADVMLAALAAGAFGYLFKPIPRTRLADALSAAACGQPALCEQAQWCLIEHARRFHAIPAARHLSRMELAVANYLTSRLRETEIANRLGRKQSTIHEHLKRIYKKLGVHSRRQAAQRLFPAPEG